MTLRPLPSGEHLAGESRQVGTAATDYGVIVRIDLNKGRRREPVEAA